MTIPSLFSPSPLVGRDRELGVLRDQLTAAIAGRGSLVLIGGEAGIGKTTLVEAVCQEASDRGALVLVGRCYDLTKAPPYGPWVELFSRYRPTNILPPPPDAFAERGTVGEVTSQAAIFRQMLDFIEAFTVARPVIVLLDNLHWPDPASLDLLRFLSRSLADAPILALATYRSDELTRHHPLYQLLPVLERETRATRLDLHRLSMGAVRSLVRYRCPLPEPYADRLIDYLFERAEGNAFFTLQVLRALEEEDVRRHTDGAWAVEGLDRMRLPMAVLQVIDGRLLHLDEET